FELLGLGTVGGSNHRNQRTELRACPFSDTSECLERHDMKDEAWSRVERNRRVIREDPTHALVAEAAELFGHRRANRHCCAELVGIEVSVAPFSTDREAPVAHDDTVWAAPATLNAHDQDRAVLKALDRVKLDRGDPRIDVRVEQRAQLADGD